MDTKPLGITVSPSGASHDYVARLKGCDTIQGQGASEASAIGDLMQKLSRLGVVVNIDRTGLDHRQLVLRDLQRGVNPMPGLLSSFLACFSSEPLLPVRRRDYEVEAFRSFYLAKQVGPSSAAATRVLGWIAALSSQQVSSQQVTRFLSLLQVRAELGFFSEDICQAERSKAGLLLKSSGSAQGRA